ncbi:hypothetical protein [Pleomorphochaeta sp. DL1XJH-081]|uniref:hypothetical protein n=1 Tax=Pleomorphochaeta sp. DL1XJH-081 TaxID=3409690 RepID=UPI003BB513B8
MEKQPRIEANGFLLALGLSQTASQRIMAIRSRLWKSTGDLSFHFLPPIIPLIWSQSRLMEFERMQIPCPPKHVEFSRIARDGYSLYLASDSNGWDTYINRLRHYLSDFAETPTNKMKLRYPLAPSDGPFLGYVETSIGDTMEMLDHIIGNKDWRLQQYELEWIEDEGRYIHLKYSLLTNIHIV